MDISLPTHQSHSIIKLFKQCKRAVVIETMLKHKYTLSKNHGLLPKIDTKTEDSIITTYALLNKTYNKQYQLHVHPQSDKTVVMFNHTEYLHRQCSTVIVDNDATKTLRQIAGSYPKEDHTLAIFIANDPEEATRLVLGPEQDESLLELAYHQLVADKQKKSEIFLSVVGIQSENSLTDELDFDLAHNGENPFDKNEWAQSIFEAKGRTKINVAKQANTNTYYAEKATKHGIPSKESLHSLLKRYRQMKHYLEGWLQVKQQRQHHLLGEIYHLWEARYDQFTGELSKPLKSHYILKINQYVRASSPLLLKLGMILKRVYAVNFKHLETHDTKVFKLLSECFSRHRTFHYHLFLQIGEYNALKQEYLCLAPTSQHLNASNSPERDGHDQSQFMFSKHYLENEHIMKVIASLQRRKEDPLQTESLFFRENEEDAHPIKFKIKTRSYHCDTTSSAKKRIHKTQLVTEGNQSEPMFDLEELVQETRKIYRLPSLSISKESIQRGIQERSKRSILRATKPSKPSKLHQKVSLNAGKSRSRSPNSDAIINSGKRAENSNKYHRQLSTQIKGWLDFVYGNKRKNKVKQFYRNAHRKTETVGQNKNKQTIVPDSKYEEKQESKNRHQVEDLVKSSSVQQPQTPSSLVQQPQAPSSLVQQPQSSSLAPQQHSLIVS